MHADRETKTIYGYMTVEAAFIIPWTIFIIAWLIYLGYFEYDRCLLFQDNYILASQASAQIKTRTEKQSWLSANIPERTGNKYMGTSRVNMEGYVSGSRIKMTSSHKVSHPLSFHDGFIPEGNWNISDTVNADNFSFTERLRIQRGIGRVAEGILGGD